MDYNIATTVSFCAAATCATAAVLAAYLSRGPASRHFRFVAVAGLAGSLYGITDVVLAGGLSVRATVLAGRLSLLAATVHAAAWLAFLASWDQRPLSRFERVLVIASVLGGALALVPGVAVVDTVTPRDVVWFDARYSDPGVGPLGNPIMGVAYVAQLAAAAAAVRMSRRNPRARLVGGALALFSLVETVEWLAALHVIAFPSLVDPAIALVFVSIGCVVMRDAAESAAKSAELDRARVALAERDNLAALGQLAAVVAHEVRNPVAIVFGALATLQRTARTAEDEKLLAIIGEEAERLKQLVTRLLEAVRPFELQYSRREVGQVLRAAIAQVTSSAGVETTQVELVSAPADEVECDEVLLGQAISNLVQNALNASGRRAPVRVRASVEPSPRQPMLCIEIADDGDGVPLGQRARLFTPFFTTRATGTGLGLAIVKRIAGAHGGTVEYEPPASGGASFVLRVPLRASDVSPKRLLGDDVR